MRFKTDENLPVDLAELLRSAGHEAVTVVDQQMAGSTDEALAAACRNEHRILITLDVDFADFQTYPPAKHAGIIVLRLRKQDKPHVLSNVGRLLSILEVEPLDGRLWIVDENRLRIRS